MVHPVPSDIRTAGETANWKKVIPANRGAAGGILGNKIFQTFFFFSKRSEAERELLKNYIPPTHLRPP